MQCGEGRTTVVGRAFGITWNVLVNLLYIVIVLYVLSRAYSRDPGLTVTLGAIGLVYTTLRGMGTAQHMLFSPMLGAILADLNEIKEMYGLPISDRSQAYVTVLEREQMKQVNDSIDLGFLFLISIICVFAIFGSL
jgi:hypothetical protein